MKWKAGLQLMVGLAIGLIIASGYWGWRWREQLRVIRVIDGDTLVIKTGERVRLIGLDAPETGKCYAEEATAALAEMTEGKVIAILGTHRDSWGRRLGQIFVGKTNVNLELIRMGAVRYDSFADEKSAQMEALGRQAETDKRGLFGPQCENETPCGILGNIDQSSGKKYYHVPGCPTYPRVKIDPERGEKVFCTEKEAEKGGFVLAPDCGS